MPQSYQLTVNPHLVAFLYVALCMSFVGVILEVFHIAFAEDEDKLASAIRLCLYMPIMIGVAVLSSYW